MTDGDIIEGEVVNDRSEALPAVAPENSHQVVTFNPLDAEPVAFRRKLVSRQENYLELASFMREMLIPGKDFGRIHHANRDKCPKPHFCSFEKEPYHWSGYSLWAPGADKVLAMLGLEATYPGHEDYIRAAVTGKQIADIIIKCHILGTAEKKIAEGMGATSRKDHKGDLNNSLKIACKRARVDAVLRLPGMSALFEDDFLAQIAAEAAKKKGGNSTTARQQQSKTNQYNTGARLVVMPIGRKGKMLGKKFAEMEEYEIQWILGNLKDKPDIFNAAQRQWDERFAEPATTEPCTDDGPSKDSAGEEEQGPAAPAEPLTHADADWLKDFEDGDEWGEYEGMHDGKTAEGGK